MLGADIYFPAIWKAELLGEGQSRQPLGAPENCFRAQGKQEDGACLSPSVKALDLSTNPHIDQHVELCEISNQHFRRLKYPTEAKQDAIQPRGLLQRKSSCSCVRYWLTNDWKLMLLGELRGTPGHAAGFVKDPPVLVLV